MKDFDSVTIDIAGNSVVAVKNGESQKFPIDSPEAFEAISTAWLRSGWDTKYVYSFTWLGRPIIQLPEDMFRIQEVIYKVQPDVILETGIAHGGSLIFYADLCKAIGKGRVIGVDIEIRPHNRKAIESHELFEYITMIEGSSISEETVRKVHDLISVDEKVLVVLDSNHLKPHVLAELEAYSDLVSVGSYIVACDGIMGHLSGAPRTSEDWGWNNPEMAAKEFQEKHPNFVIENPAFQFNEGQINKPVTYWPNGYLRRTK
jgi:cephalosporin hydroxylase